MPRKPKSPEGAATGRRTPLPAELLPLAPLLYVAWADGTLTAAELAELQEYARDSHELDAAQRGALEAWLDPADPPGAADLQTLLERIRERVGGAHVGADGGADGAEADAGLMALMGGAGGDDDRLTAAAQRMLAGFEDASGLTRAELLRSLQAALAPTARPRPAEDGPLLDSGVLHAYIDSDHYALRQRVLELLSGPDFAYVDARDTAAYRETVLRWCAALAQHGLGALAYPREFGGSHDVAGAIAVFETLAFHDTSLLVKYGVQFGLFAGSIYMLGTRTHHERFLRAAASLELPGCFAMTETGHGSNVRDLETTAAYDVASGEFVVHTPHPAARKDYIGNAAVHGRLAVVFAQLLTDTGAHGVHAFLVPIRDADGVVLPGVAIEDCGLKVGLNGVDNGRISFDHVRIPGQNLLDRYGSVSEGGAYASPITSSARRFFTMIGTLVAGRISIACASLSAGKIGLTIAVRHTARRRQFGPEGEPEVPLLDYTVMQRTLLPRLAAAYALDFAMKALVRRFAASAADESQEIETLAAALKAYASDWNVETLQAAREACGGQGYLAENRLGALRADTDVFTTFEGANAVLYQLVARGRLSEYREEFGELTIRNVARHLGARAATRVLRLNPIATRRTDAEHLLNPRFHSAALRYREDRLLASLATRLKRRLDDGSDPFTAFNECQDHAVELGRAFAERFLMDCFQQGVRDSPPAVRPHLARLSALFALDRLTARAGWYLEVGYIEPVKSRAIRRQLNDVCTQVRGQAEALVDGFGIPDALLAVPGAAREAAPAASAPRSRGG
jgi:acyl-CoA oxidase